MTPPAGISVVGTGQVSAPPDLMTVDIGVSSRSGTVAEASATSRNGANALLEALTASGVDRKDVVTVTLTVFPEYDHRNGEQRLLGYRVTNELRVTLRDIAGAGDILDRALAAAGDAATVHNVAFSIEDDAALLEQARDLAWNDARSKAGHLAQLAGLALGPAVSIAEGRHRDPGPPRPMARMAMAEASTPIEGGASTVTVTLEVRFDLAG